MGVPSGLDELKIADFAPRVISDDAPARPRNAVQRFRCVAPIVVNVRGGEPWIVGGHQRLKVLQALGVKKVWCATVNCTPAEAKLLNLTLNKKTAAEYNKI